MFAFFFKNFRVQEKKNGRRKSADQKEKRIEISVSAPSLLKRDSIKSEKDFFEKETLKASSVRWKEPSTSKIEKPSHKPTQLTLLPTKSVLSFKNTNSKAKSNKLQKLSKLKHKEPDQMKQVASASIRDEKIVFSD